MTPLESIASETASGKLQLAAEALFAEHGIDGVSTREIAKRAGQKNHSAVAYHFGSKEALVQEILDQRMLPIDRRRQGMLAYLEQAGQTANVRALVGALVVPLAEALQADLNQSDYIGLICQLYTSPEGITALEENPGRKAGVDKVGAYLVAVLPSLPAPILQARLDMLNAQISLVIADWDRRRRDGQRSYAATELPWLTENLVDSLSAGLLAQVSAPTRKGFDRRHNPSG